MIFCCCCWWGGCKSDSFSLVFLDCAWAPGVTWTCRCSQVVHICTCHCKICTRSHSRCLFLPVCVSHTHTLSNSLYQIKVGPPSPHPPPTLCRALWAVNAIQSNGCLEDTKTSSYLTPDTNLRALGLKRRRTNTEGPNRTLLLRQEGSIQGGTDTGSPCNQGSTRSPMGPSPSVHAQAAPRQPNANSGVLRGSR